MPFTARGINVGEPFDYRLNCPFKNEMRIARVFFESSDGQFLVNARLTDEDPATGYPRTLAPGIHARTVVGTSTRETGGTWRVDWIGSGVVQILNGATNQQGSSGFSFTRDTSESVQVIIRSTNPANPVRDIWLGEDRYYATRNELRCKPEWVAHIIAANARMFRSMQWQSTNTSTVTSWTTQRPRTYYTDSNITQDGPMLSNGCSIDSLLIMAIELATPRLWVSVPHLVDEGQASVGWVDQFLRYVQTFRHPFLNTTFTGDVAFEYSNETWNTAQIANLYCRQRGQALSLDGANEYEQGHQFYALRSSQVFATALATRAAIGLANPIVRILAGQANVGEYTFRFRTQINPTHASPVNVAADEYSVAAYYGHTDQRFGDFLDLSGIVGTFQVGENISNGILNGARGVYRFAESGTRLFVEHSAPWISFAQGQTITGQTSGATATISSLDAGRVGQVRIGEHAVAWRTAAQYAALTDAEISTDLQRDIDLRLFAPVGSYSDPTFPSAPTIRTGGILAELAFAKTSRGLRLVCYEGGCDHMTLPQAQADLAPWSAAMTRNVAFHRTQASETLNEQLINRFEDAGVDGLMIFDDGTAWSGRYGCWSWYEDHRNGYTDQRRYLATQRAFTRGGGGGNIVSQINLPPVTIRAGAFATASLTLPPISSTLASATLQVGAGSPQNAIGTAINSELASATLAIGAGRMNGASIISPPALVSFLAPSRTRALAASPTSTVITPIAVSTLAPATVFVCAVGMEGTVRVPSRVSALREATVYVNTGAGASMTSAVRGALNTEERRVLRAFVPTTLKLHAAPVPHGTEIYPGHVYGYVGDRVRPLIAGDRFAGFSMNRERGTTYDNEGFEIIRSTDYFAVLAIAGDVWLLLNGPQPSVGDQVFALNDVTLTTEDTGSPVGHVVRLSRGMRRALVSFRNVALVIE